MAGCKWIADIKDKAILYGQVVQVAEQTAAGIELHLICNLRKEQEN